MKLNRIVNFVPNTFGYDLKIIAPDELYNDARRFETLGQRADPSLMCLLNTAEILGDIGFQAIEDRVRYLGTLVYDGFLTFPNFPMTTPANLSQRIGVIIAGVDPDVSRNNENIYMCCFMLNYNWLILLVGFRIAAGRSLFTRFWPHAWWRILGVLFWKYLEINDVRKSEGILYMLGLCSIKYDKNNYCTHDVI